MISRAAFHERLLIIEGKRFLRRFAGLAARVIRERRGDGEIQ
jgi:hypothetical protein